MSIFGFPATTYSKSIIKSLCAALIFIMVGLLLIFGINTPAHGEIIGTVTGSNVNIRTGANINSTILFTAAKGSTYEVINEQNGWYRIRVSGHEETWISGTYLKCTTNDTLPQSVTTTDTVNLRTGPSTSTDIITTLKKGAGLNVTGESGYWYQVKYDGSTAYIAKWLVEANSTTVDPTPEPEPNPGSTTEAEVMKDISAKAVITASVVNLRAEPSDQSAILGKMSKNTTVYVYERQGDWYHIVTSDNQVGWAFSDYVGFSGSTASSVPTPTTLPEFTGTTSQGTIKVTAKTTDHGYTVTLSGDKPIIYNTTVSDNQLKIKTDMTVSGSASLGNITMSTSGSFNNILIFGSDDYIYSDMSVSTDKKTIIIELSQSPLVGKVIYLDPGHASTSSGSIDSGAVSASGLKEKDVVYDIALMTKDMLEALGAKVILSRGETTTLTLGSRATPANEAGADVLVSIHCNSSTNTSANGTSVWYYAPEGSSYDRTKCLLLANSVQEALLTAAGRRNYGIIQSGFAVLKAAKMPAILVETAFLSNPEEASLLATASFRNKLASGIVRGLTTYFRNVD